MPLAAHKKFVAYGKGRWPVSVSESGKDWAVAKFHGRFAGDGGVAWRDAEDYADFLNARAAAQTKHPKPH